jgi:CubicO group peptidase (beta-lactamase class C family)
MALEILRYRNAMQWSGLLALGLVLGPAVAWSAPDCGNAAKLEDGWTVAAPQEQSLDPALICAIGPRLVELKEANAHGVVIARHGAIVYEAYLPGEDQRWPQKHWKEPLAMASHDARTRHDVQSISKSVVALLMGAALDRGLLKSIDTPLLSLFPEYADLRTSDKDRIRVRDLLTMTSGLRWPQKPYLAMSRQMEAAADPSRFVLEQPMVAGPGLVWHYNNGSAEVAGAVVKKAAGKALDQFAKEALFDPLGIDDWEWGTMANGDPGASWGLRLRLRDLAKIGQLVLDRGRWHGQRILPETWISIMTAPHIVRSKTIYGFLWWLDREQVNGKEVDIISGYGWGGQSISVVPSLGLVVAVNAGVYDFDGQGSQNIATNTVLDAVVQATKPQ